MSAPSTNIETQKDRHKGPLAGMGAVTAFAGILLVALVVWMFAQSDGPEGASAQVDGRTGDVEAVVD